MSDEKWEEIGVIGVDAGLCWLGDPCYILHKSEGDTPKDIGESWDEFCNRLGDGYPTTKQFHYDMGHPGLGVVVSTGWGDGTYPVEIRRSHDGRVAAVRVIFIDDDE